MNNYKFSHYLGINMCIFLDVEVLHSVTTLTEYIVQGTEPL